jgi:hypothetical protein
MKALGDFAVRRVGHAKSSLRGRNGTTQRGWREAFSYAATSPSASPLRVADRLHGVAS